MAGRAGEKKVIFKPIILFKQITEAFHLQMYVNERKRFAFRGKN
jgi:hypothetical protein